MVLRLAVALCATLALAQAGPLKDGDATPVKVEAEVKRHHHSGPPTREHLAPPLLTDVYPLAGDTRGRTAITIGGHGFVDTIDMNITEEVWKASGAENFGLHCVFMMPKHANAGEPERTFVQAEWTDESTIICKTPAFDGKVPHIPLTDPNATKRPIDGRVEVRVTNDGVHISKSKVFYTYGPGDCCNPRSGADNSGCMNPVIAACVCQLDDSCCGNSRISGWDGVCAQSIITTGCQSKGIMCAADSYAMKNTKRFQQGRTIKERNALQEKLDVPWYHQFKHFSLQHFEKWMAHAQKLLLSPSDVKMTPAEMNAYFRAAVENVKATKEDAKIPEAIKDDPEKVLEALKPGKPEYEQFKLPLNHVAHEPSNMPVLNKQRINEYRRVHKDDAKDGIKDPEKVFEGSHRQGF